MFDQKPICILLNLQIHSRIVQLAMIHRRFLRKSWRFRHWGPSSKPSKWFCPVTQLPALACPQATRGDDIGRSVVNSPGKQSAFGRFWTRIHLGSMILNQWFQWDWMKMFRGRIPNHSYFDLSLKTIRAPQICMHTCIHTYIHAYIHTYIHTHTFSEMTWPIYIYIYII